MIDDESNHGDEGAIESSLVSECCGAVSIGEVVEDCFGHLTGICSECRHQATFTQRVEQE